MGRQLVFCERRSVGPSLLHREFALADRAALACGDRHVLAFRRGWWLWLLLRCSRPSTRLGLWGRRYETDLPDYRADHPTIFLRLQFAAFGTWGVLDSMAQLITITVFLTLIVEIPTI